nr:calcium-binding protein [uncultured Brevundimonas sp.]
MAYTFTTAQTAELQAILAGSAQYKFADAYARVIDFIDGQPGVPTNVLTWFRGAEKVNRSEDSFSAFIRAYTSIQKEIRDGTPLTKAELDAASNAIALEVVTQIIATGQLPTLADLRDADAGETAARFFDGDHAVWSGNILFPFLGDSTPFTTNLLTPEGDAYNLLVAWQAASIASIPAGLSVVFGDDLDSEIEDLVGTLGTFHEYFSLWAPTREFLEDTYGGAVDFASVLLSNVLNGRKTGDASLSGEDGNDIVHAGGGDDTVIATEGVDILDGGVGYDTVDFTARPSITVNIQLDVEANAKSIGKVNSGGLNISNLFNFEVIKGSSEADEFILHDVIASLELDGGGGATDRLSAFYVEEKVEIDTIVGSLSSGGQTISFRGFERFEGTANDDVFYVGDNMGVLEIDGRDGRDTVDFSRSTEALTQSVEMPNVEVIRGTNFDDKFMAGNSPSIEIYGGDGEDTLIGGRGSDILHGEDDDKKDVLEGGGGADLFIVGDLDIVQDATAADRLALSKGRFIAGEATRPEGDDGPYTSDAGYTFTQDGADLIIVADGKTITVRNFSDGDLGITLREEDDDDNDNPEVPEPPYPSPSGGHPISKGSAMGSPLVFDLDGDGIELTRLVDSGAYFDIDRNGLAEWTGWVGADDGLLTLDHNSNGRVDGAGELFGYSFTIPNAGSPDNLGGESGFGELAAYDLNRNGKIDANDAVYADLRIWRDVNGDGVSEASELFSLADLGIASISLNAQSANLTNAGNWISDVGTFKWIDGSVGSIADVWFRYDPETTRAPTSVEVPSDIHLLPNLSGGGKVLDLHSVAVTDANLANLLETFTAFGSADAAKVLPTVEAIVLGWLGADTQSATGRGKYVDGRVVYALENYYAQGFDQQGDADPRMQAGAFLTEDFQKMVSMLTLKLLAQTELGSVLLPGLGLNAGTVLTVDPSVTLEGWLANFALKAPDDVGDKHAYWLTAAKLIAYLQPTLGFTTTDFILAMDGIYAQEELGFTYSSLLPAGYISPIPMLFIGGDGGDTPVGRQSSIVQLSNGALDNGDVFFGGRGNDILRGLTGSDTYIFTRDSGNDVIEEVSKNGLLMDIEQAEEGDRNTIVFADDVTASELTFGRVGSSDLKISVPNGHGGFSVIVVRGYFGDPASVLNEIRFSDGSSMSYIDIQNKMPATAGHDYLFIVADGAVVDGLAGDDRIIGNELDQTYVFGAGSGRDQILDRAGDDEVLFKVGLTASDLILERNENDLVIRLNGYNDKLTIKEYFERDSAGAASGVSIEKFRFSDGSTLGASDVSAILKAGTSGDDNLSGGDGADILDGGVGNDNLHGGRGNDIYIFGRGSGSDRIVESLGQDTVQFGPSISVSDLHIARAGFYSEDLILQIAGTSDRLTIKGHFANGASQVETFSFSDGTILSHADLEALIPSAGGTSEDDRLYGSNGNDVLDGAGGDDYLNGGSGDDTYIFGQGYGADFIDDGDGLNTLAFAPGISLSDLTWDGDGTALAIRIAGSEDVVKVDRAFAGDGGIENYTFADGTNLSRQDVLTLVFGGTPGNDVIHGMTWLDFTVDLGAGDDQFYGTYDSVFAFGQGSGHDTLFDVRNVELKSGVGVDDVSFSQDGDDAILTIDATGDTLRFDNLFSRGAPSLTLTFKGGSTLTATDIGNAILSRAGTPGSDEIRALSDGVNILNGGAGNDTLTAGEGTSIVEFGVGFGTDVVLRFGEGDRIRFDSTIAPSDLILSISENDLIIAVGYDQLILKDFYFDNAGRPYTSTFEGIDFFGAADWTWNDIASRFRTAANGGEWLIGGTTGDVLTGTSGAETLLGGDGADTLAGGAGDGDILDGGNGGDHYVFNLGDGQDRLFENSYDNGTDVVTFGTGISKNNIVVTSNNGRAVAIAVANTLDALIINDLSAIESFVFSDGILSAEAIAALAIATQNTDGDDAVWGFDLDNVFSSGAGDDVLHAGMEGNEFVFAAAFGHDVVEGNAGSSGWNEIFLSDLLPHEVSVHQSLGANGQLQLVISDLSGDRSVTLTDWGAGARWGYSSDGSQFSIRFADDTRWDRDAVNAVSMIDSSTPGDDFIVGNDNDEIFDAGAGSDVIYGGGGADVVMFGVGAGRDAFHGETVKIVIGDGLELSDLHFRREGGSYSEERYIVSIIGTQDQISISDMPYAPQGLSFVIGGLTYSYTALSDLFHSGTPGADRLQGTEGADVLEGLGGADTLIGQWGADDYIFGTQFGSDVVLELGGAEALDVPPAYEQDTIIFTAYNFADLVFTRVGDDLSDLLVVGTGGDRILIQDFYVSLTQPNEAPLYGIDRFIFADDTVMLRAEFLNVVADMSGDNTVRTDNNGGILEGGDGDDTLEGGRGNDTYVFGLGDKSDLILDAGGARDSIAFKPDVNPLNVSRLREGEDLLLQVEGEGGLTIRVVGQFRYVGPVVESFVFADGTAWSWEDVRDAVLAEEGTGEDVIIGTFGDDFLIASGFDDVIRGLGGDDWIDGAAGVDTLELAGISADYVWSRQADGSVTVTNQTTLDTSQLYNVERVYFIGDKQNLEIGDLVSDYGTAGDDAWIEGTAGADNLFGLTGDDTLAGRGGDDVVVGGDGEDVFSISGIVTDYTFSRNADGSVSIAGGEGADTLIDMEAIYFEGASSWRSLESLVGQYGTREHDTWLEGSSNADNLFGLGGDDTLIGRAGNDVIDGGAGYDQANYVGDFADFVFARQADGRITVTDTTLAEGSDVLVEIEAVYFDGSGTWSSLSSLVANYGTAGDDAFLEGTVYSDNLYGLAGDDTLVGRQGDDFLFGGEGFDQANYYGSSTDFSFTQNSDGTVTVTDLVGNEGSDILSAVEAVYFNGDQVWGTLEDALADLGSREAQPHDAAAHQILIYSDVNDEVGFHPVRFDQTLDEQRDFIFA